MKNLNQDLVNRQFFSRILRLKNTLAKSLTTYLIEIACKEEDPAYLEKLLQIQAHFYFDHTPVQKDYYPDFGKDPVKLLYEDLKEFFDLYHKIVIAYHETLPMIHEEKKAEADESKDGYYQEKALAIPTEKNNLIEALSSLETKYFSGYTTFYRHLRSAGCKGYVQSPLRSSEVHPHSRDIDVPKTSVKVGGESPLMTWFKSQNQEPKKPLGATKVAIGSGRFKRFKPMLPVTN